MMRMAVGAMAGVILAICLFTTAPAAGVSDDFVFDFHSARMRRDADLPPVRLNSTEVALGEVCLFGEPPHALPRKIIATFTELLRDVYGRRLAVTFAGREITNCPRQQRVYIRLYSGLPPEGRFNDDLREMEREFDIRFPPNWNERVKSPAQTNGFFGRNGAAAHVLVSQPPAGELTPLQRDFYTSILVEELFQVVTFGADILKFNRDTPFVSKLQEHPVNLRYLPWTSERFMTGLLQSNPKGLCGFDVFMLHALAASNLETTNSTALLDYIDGHFDELRGRVVETLAKPAYAPVLDADCASLPG